MKYFLHDTSAFDDEKISELFIEFGYEGLGLFYTILEKIAKQEKPVKTLVLKHQLKVGKKLEKCWNFMESLGIISSNNGETFNKQLLNFSEKYQIKKEKNAKKISEWREKQELEKNVTSYEPFCNDAKVNESKVNESKVNESKKNYKNIPLSEICISDFPEIKLEYFEVAKGFQLLFHENLNQAGAPTKIVDNAKGIWIDDIRLMIENDGATVEGLRDVFQFLKKDDFWKKNILSTKKLREQFPKLKMQINGKSKNFNGAARITEDDKRRLVEGILGCNNI